MIDLPGTAVPCNGCTACCKDDAIILHPKEGDNPADYLTEKTVNPITGKPALMLQKQADGSCIYLERGVGCTIHGKAPIICRTFDCRRFYRLNGAAKVKRMIAAGIASQEVADAGRRRSR